MKEKSGKGLKKTMAPDIFRLEIQLLRLKAVSRVAKFKEHDTEIETEIRNNSEDSEEKNTSLQIWEVSKLWFSNYESNFINEHYNNNPFFNKI